MIERAKIKKQYAKVLAETGGKSDRLKVQRSERATAKRAGVSSQAETVGAADDNDPKEDGNDSDTESVASDASSALGLAGDKRDEESDSDDEAAAFAAREKAMLRGKRPERLERPTKAPLDRKPFDAQRPGAIGKSPRAKGKQERPKPYARDQRDRPPHMQRGARKEKPVRALSPPTLPDAKEGSMRDIKKEGFSKFHRTSTGKRQPNMAARMDVLLEKIRRAT